MAEDDVVIPALLRAARGSYGQAIRSQLAAAGFTDMPANGPFILGGVVNHGARVEDMLRQLGRRPSTEALVDTMVVRGYLARVNDSAGGVTIEVTDRGRAAAIAVAAGVASVEDELDSMITPEERAGMRAGLIALCTIRERGEAAARNRSNAEQHQPASI